MNNLEGFLFFYFFYKSQLITFGLKFQQQARSTPILTFCGTAAEAALEASAAIDELHERIHVGLTPITPHGTHLTQVYSGRRSLEHHRYNMEINIEGVITQYSLTSL